MLGVRGHQDTEQGEEGGEGRAGISLGLLGKPSMGITAFRWLDGLGPIPKDGPRLLCSGKFSLPPQGDHLTGQSDLRDRWEMAWSVRSTAHCELGPLWVLC